MQCNCPGLVRIPSQEYTHHQSVIRIARMAVRTRVRLSGSIHDWSSRPGLLRGRVQTRLEIVRERAGLSKQTIFERE